MTEIPPVDVVKVQEENPQSRFHVLNTAIRSPGTCIMCKSAGGDGRQFVDLGIQVNWIGALYFCTYCVAEASTMIGFISPTARDELFAKYEEFLLKYGNEKLETERLTEQLNAARVLLRDCRCITTGPVDSRADSDVEADSIPKPSDPDADKYGDGEKSGDISVSTDDDPFAPVTPKRNRSRKSAE